MNPDDLAKVLDELGERLGPTGEYVFALAVRQVYINAVLFGVFFVVSVALTVWASSRLIRWAADDGPYGDRGLLAVFAGTIMIVVTGALGLQFLGFSLPDVLNPEYAAIRDLLSNIVP